MLFGIQVLRCSLSVLTVLQVLEELFVPIERDLTGKAVI